MTTAPNYLIRVFLVAAVSIAALAGVDACRSWPGGGGARRYQHRGRPASSSAGSGTGAAASSTGSDTGPGPRAELPPRIRRSTSSRCRIRRPLPQEEPRPVTHADSGTTRSEAARDSAPASTPADDHRGRHPATYSRRPPNYRRAAQATTSPSRSRATRSCSGQAARATAASTAVLGSFRASRRSQRPRRGSPRWAARPCVPPGCAGRHSGARLVLVDSSGNTMLFFNLFGGGGGGGAALVFLTALGLLTIFRMMPPDWNSAFRNSTAVWGRRHTCPQSSTPASRSS